MTRRSLLILILLAAGTAEAQTSTGRVLLPIVATNSVPGAFGSLWISDIVVFNDSSNKADISYSLSCSFTCGSGVTLGPGQSIDILNALTRPGIPALFINTTLVDPSRDHLQFGLRVRDLLQQATSVGAAIPIVRDADAFSRPFDLLNVPLEARYRQTLRVYDLAATGASSVTVRYYSMTSGALLKESQLALVFPANETPAPQVPGYGEVGFFGAVPELTGTSRVRVRIVPTTATQRLWAMASVTNNDTQELTIVSPDN